MPSIDLTKRYYILLNNLQRAAKSYSILNKRFGTWNVNLLTEEQLQSLVNDLQEELNEKCRKSRRTIIHYLCVMGYVTPDDTPDFDRINHFVENIGKNNPKKKILNYLSPSELNAVVTQVKARHRHELKRLAEGK